MATDNKRSILNVLQASNQKTAAKTDEYLQYFDKKTDSKKKSETSKKMVNTFYDLATDFYEYGWGESFHFSRIEKGDTFKEATMKHELYLAMKLALRPDEKVLDLGCGVGGPARTIAHFSKAKVTGINNNDYQAARAITLTEKAKLSHLCTYKKGDFTCLEEASGSVDKVYACEATCHARDKSAVFGEAFRVLKPGGLFANYDWLVTAKYDPDNHEHAKIVHDIMEGNALPDIQSIPDNVATLRAVGFEVLEEEDLSLTSEVPWESPLEPGWFNLKATPVGRSATHCMLYCMEKLGLSPKGSTRVHSMLCLGADGLVKGAKAGIFTPMFFTLARKPATSK